MQKFDKTLEFQSTLPVWGATLISLNVMTRTLLFQSTLPVWGATRLETGLEALTVISIHAPRVGSDVFHKLALKINVNFNPRSPCGERLIIPMIWTSNNRFQSTLPVWGATLTALRKRLINNYFNPRSPCGERPRQPLRIAVLIAFQSTLPVWGATCQSGQTCAATLAFQSTLPVWGATAKIHKF